jgi:4-amino-4-deoxy-L-arabinose transferase-like glycosyltransferase
MHSRNKLQKAIHRLEVGGGTRYVQIGFAVLALLLFAVCYNWRAFRNMSCPEAMDAAQVARNLASGDGYTTLFIRPLSVHLLQSQGQAAGQKSLGFGNAEAARLNGMHPDLANPPAYPVVLAGLMWTLDKTRIFPFHYAIPSKPQPFWSKDNGFWRYQPDFLISVFNQLLFLGLVVVVYFLARQLFDPGVARLSAFVLLATELFWRFSVSGLSTLLLLIVFAGLAWCIFLLDRESREPKFGRSVIFAIAALAGLLVGIGGLTRYAFLWLIIPLLTFVVVFTGLKRLTLALITLLAFAAVVTPWLIRNYRLSGTPFGTASYTMIEGTAFFPEYKLQRSLNPDLSQVYIPGVFWRKLTTNARLVVQNDLPKLGGNWISAFFLAGLLIGFRNLAVRRLRYFLIGCIVVLAIVQALGRTQLSEDSPEINSENLLILVAPLVIVYGVSLFYLLLEQVALPFREARYIAIGVFVGVACLPLILTFVGPRAVPINFPPYYPPSIQTSAAYIKGVSGKQDAKGNQQTDPGELMMSDIPWAVAWYGYSQCVWLTLNPQNDFFAINDYDKPIQAIYLTPLTVDKLSFIDWGLIMANAQSVFLEPSTQDRIGEMVNTGSIKPLEVSFSRPPLPLHNWQWMSWRERIFLLTARPHWAKED